MNNIVFIVMNPHYQLGGIEAYNRLLFERYNSKFSITELSLIVPKEELKISSSINNIDEIYDQNISKKLINFYKINIFLKIFQKRKIEKLITKLFIDKNFPKGTIIINCTNFKISRNLKSNTIWVQHFDPNFLKFKNTKKVSVRYLLTFYNFIFKKYLPWNWCQYTVTFDSKNRKNLDIKNNNNNFCIPIAMYNKETIIKNFISKSLSPTPNRIIFLGRLNNGQKNIVFLNEVASYLNEIIDVYGYGEDESLLDLKNMNYLGKYNSAQIPKILENAKFLIMTSDYEGFPVVCVEALSHGVPCMLRNTFESAGTLTSYYKNLLVEKDKTPWEYAQILEKSFNMSQKDYQLMLVNLQKFVLKELNLHTFYESWDKILEKVKSDEKDFNN